MPGARSNNNINICNKNININNNINNSKDLKSQISNSKSINNTNNINNNSSPILRPPIYEINLETRTILQIGAKTRVIASPLTLPFREG